MGNKTNKCAIPFKYCYKSISFPGSPPTQPPWRERERERDPGVVWSQVRWTIDIIREGSFDFRILLVTFLSTSKRGYLEKSNKHFNHHNVHYLLSSLYFASFSSSYSNVSLKAKKVQCLESSYGGQDV